MSVEPCHNLKAVFFFLKTINNVPYFSFLVLLKRLFVAEHLETATAAAEAAEKKKKKKF